MTTIRALLLAVALLLLAGCGGDESPALTLALPAGTPPEVVELIRATAPAIERELPGLFKYQDAMTFSGVDAHCPYWAAPGSGLPEDVSVTWLKFVVAEDGGPIPKEYYAWGHHLRIGIVDTGKALILQKRQAQSVFLDKPTKHTGQDLVIKI